LLQFWSKSDLLRKLSLCVLSKCVLLVSSKENSGNLRRPSVADVQSACDFDFLWIAEVLYFIVQANGYDCKVALFFALASSSPLGNLG
jgi:hypothetical protein